MLIEFWLKFKNIFWPSQNLWHAPCSPPPSSLGGEQVKNFRKAFPSGEMGSKKLFWFGGCIKSIFTFQNNQLNILQVHQKYPLMCYQVYHIKIFSMCISFTSCLFPIEAGSKTFGDLGEFNSMRTWELKILGLGGHCFFFWGGSNFVRGEGSVHHYIP